MIVIRRRMYVGILLIVASGLIALLLAVVLLWDRTGTLIVTADQPDALIVLNGEVTETRVGTPINKIRPDTYTVSVAFPGYQCKPTRRIIRVKARQTARASFSLFPIPKPTQTEEKIHKAIPSTEVRQSQAAPSTVENRPRKASAHRTGKKTEPKSTRETPPAIHTGTIKIKTTPVQGSIFVDDIFKGKGKVVLTDVDLGELVVRFGEMEGYRTPKPQKVFLTQDWPYANIEGVYLPLIYITAYLDPAGRTITKKCRLHTGYVWNESETYDDPVAGPGIKFLDDIGTFAWEIGYAFSNRNPSGEDFLEISFNLPENFDGNKSLELQLFGYASSKKYPFAVGGKTAIHIFINGRKIKDSFHPHLTLTPNVASEPDVLPINTFLQVGKNRIRIQASASSRCYYYLRQIVIL